MKMILIITLGAILTLSLFLIPVGSHAAGTTYYIDNTNSSCNDLGTGTTPSQPFCTITAGKDMAIAGDTVRVLAGTYAEKVRPDIGGVAGSPITYSAAPGVTVTGDGSASGRGFSVSDLSYITIDGFNVTQTSDHGIYVARSDHIIISNNHVSYARNQDPLDPYPQRCGIYLSATTDSTITGNRTDHNTLDGIRLIKSSLRNTVSNNVSFANASGVSRSAEGIDVENNSTANMIIHNIVYANEDSGLNFVADSDPGMGSGSNLVIGNVSYGNGDHGIDNNKSPNNIIIGNTVQGNVTSGINLEGEIISTVIYGSGGAIVKNNIVVDNGLCQYVGGEPIPDTPPGNIRVDALSTPGTFLDYNLYYLTSGGTQLIWGTISYSSIEFFHSLFPGQETNGLLGDPLFTMPAAIAMRPPAPPYNMAVNVGIYYVMSGSPAIDSANSDAPSEPDFDILGLPRVDDPLVVNSGSGLRTYDDRGAYEYYGDLILFKVMLPLIMR